jgi:hypothetical protein
MLAEEEEGEVVKILTIGDSGRPYSQNFRFNKLTLENIRRSWKELVITSMDWRRT